MRVVGWKEFATLPEGTIFSYYKPRICEGLYRKCEMICRDKNDGSEAKGAIDFYQCSLVPECLNGEPPTLDAYEQRWGMFDYSQQFAVFEEEDLSVLRELLE